MESMLTVARRARDSALEMLLKVVEKYGADTDVARLAKKQYEEACEIVRMAEAV